jgi:hypothetical protein
MEFLTSANEYHGPKWGRKFWRTRIDGKKKTIWWKYMFEVSLVFFLTRWEVIPLNTVRQHLHNTLRAAAWACGRVCVFYVSLEGIIFPSLNCTERSCDDSYSSKSLQKLVYYYFILGSQRVSVSVTSFLYSIITSLLLIVFASIGKTRGFRRCGALAGVRRRGWSPHPWTPGPSRVWHVAGCFGTPAVWSNGGHEGEVLWCFIALVMENLILCKCFEIPAAYSKFGLKEVEF